MIASASDTRQTCFNACSEIRLRERSPRLLTVVDEGKDEEEELTRVEEEVEDRVDDVDEIDDTGELD